MTRLRVALLGGYLTDPGIVRGGVQAATTCLFNKLSYIDDLELHVLTWQRSGQGGVDRIARDGMTIYLLPSLPRFERLTSYRTYQKILDDRLAIIRPHVIHSQEAAADAYVALRSGYPTIITVHGIRNEDRKYSRSWGQRMRFFIDGVLTERKVIGRTRYLIAISQYVIRYFADRFRSDLRCFFIPNPVDEKFLELNDTASQPLVLFAGRVTPLKRVLDLVQAFTPVVRQIPAAQLHIAGECQTDATYVESIRETVQRAGLENHVQLLGELDQDKLLQEYASCSLLVLPSAQENSPMVVAQAMAASKPVVATRVGGVAEMVGENGARGLLVPVGAVDRLAEAILSLLQDPGQREQMGQAGRKFAQQNYHPEAVATRTAEVYREVVAREASVHG